MLWVSQCGGKVWPGSTPYDLWAQKTGEKPDSFEDNVHTWYGKAMELPICQWVAEEVGGELKYPAPYTMVTRDDADWMAATPDAWLLRPEGECLIEAKTSSWAVDWGAQGESRVPDNYLAQVLWQLAVCELNVCYLAAFLTYATDGYAGPKVTKDRRYYRLFRLPVIEQMMIEVSYTFLTRYVQSGWPPPKKTRAGWLTNKEAA